MNEFINYGIDESLPQKGRACEWCAGDEAVPQLIREQVR